MSLLTALFRRRPAPAVLCDTTLEHGHDLHHPGLGRHTAVLRTPDALRDVVIEARNHERMGQYLLRRFEAGLVAPDGEHS